MQTRLGREPNLQELSQETGLPREEIVMALEANGEVESIYKSTGTTEGKEIRLVDRLPQEKDSHEILLNHMVLEQLLQELPEMERKIIELRYFAKQGVTIKVISGDNPLTVSRVAKQAGISGSEKYIDAQTIKDDEYEEVVKN